MKTLLLVSFLSIVFSVQIHSQNRFHSIREHQFSSPKKTIGILVQGDTATLKREIFQFKGTVTAVAGSIIAAQIPAESIIRFSQLPSVRQFECGVRYTPLNVESVIHSRSDKVHQGVPPLKKSSTGKGVIVGIIDTGIDFFHPEFMVKSDGTRSRIQYIWDQNDTMSVLKPIGFTYGTEWNYSQIQATINGDSIVRHRDVNYSSHGTHVSGTAAGLSGHAPDADIIVVALDWDRSSSLVDASLYLVQKSVELGRPIVINASLGSHEVPHDGSDLSTQFIDSLVAIHPQVGYVVAAGNEGNSPIHWQVQCTDSVQMTYTQSGSMSSFFELNMNENLILQLRLDSISYASGKPIITSLYTSEELVYEQLLKDSIISVVFETLTKDTVVEFAVVATLMGNKKELLVTTRYKSPKHYIGFLVKGKEKLHAWHWGNWLRLNAQDIGVQGYVPTDSYYSLRAPGTGKNVLTVGAYVNRGKYVNIKGDTLSKELIAGKRASFSSIGPTTDERLKPEISAPGQNVFSASPTTLLNKPVNRLVGDSITAVNSGTSMACPAVTGIVALYYEENPTTPFSEIKKRITASANQDTFSYENGTLPNTFWGFGKIDAFALQSTVISSVQSSTVSDSYCSISSVGNSSMYLRLSFPTIGEYTLQFMDSKGTILKTIPWQCYSVGTYSMLVPLDHIGLVLLQVKKGNTVQSQTVGINY